MTLKQEYNNNNQALFPKVGLVELEETVLCSKFLRTLE